MRYHARCAMKNFLIPICILLCLSAWALGATEPDDAEFVHEPTESYIVRELHGFTVHVSSAAMANPDTTDPALELLEAELVEVIELTPKHAHRVLRTVKVWVEHNAPEHACACYHPGKQWLIDNGFNPDKVKGIEIANPKNFVNWTNNAQPLMVLHELAHAYHDLVLGFDHELVRTCWNNAVSSGNYDEVMHVSGNARRHYALTNDREYFAELTEAYFGRNDFAPFDREALRTFDPQGFDMIERLWLHPAESDEEDED
jgi:hypothetical protein